jgi:hypothetical protein
VVYGIAALGYAPFSMGAKAKRKIKQLQKIVLLHTENKKLCVSAVIIFFLCDMHLMVTILAIETAIVPVGNNLLQPFTGHDGDVLNFQTFCLH